MKKYSIVIVALLFSVCTVFIGCDAVKNANNTQKGAVIGASTGALIGGLITHNAKGALIGAAIGGVAGGLIGNKMDKQAREIQEALPGASVERVGEGIKLVLGEDAVRFDLNKSTITPTGKANLDKLIPVFDNYPDTNITIFGYTDSSGKVDYNLKLSEQRAAAVSAYFVSKGLKASRFIIKGMGIADPIASNDTSEGMAKNRRVEFAITANEKMVEEAKK